MSTTRGRNAKVAAIQDRRTEVAALTPVYRRVQSRVHGGVTDGVARHDCRSSIDLLCLMPLAYIRAQPREQLVRIPIK